VNTYAILPVKRFERAKQRLGGALSDGSRWALAEAMVTDVLVALRRAKNVDHVLMVTCEPRAESLAIGWGADVIADPQERSHSNAATLGIREAVERGATRVLLVPGDCPSLDAREVDALLGAPGEGVIVVPDRHGTGTNALVLDPPDAIEPAFGPGSCERHVDRAHDASVHVEIQHTPSLMLDVDTGEDLEALQEALAASTGGAAHTRGMLARLGRL
jgi:2-phospho-L-lactate/phosphoenolpyruvate guanylyltransferase